uniref:Putative endonuclease n=1 Tax=viral metagenome TaxID=1070528 RepID=A0A6M3IUP4_9ZZZZ
MIDLFEDITYELTPYELEQVALFVTSFQKRVGKDKIISNAQIQAHYKKLGGPMSGVRVRKIINYIRNEGLVSCLVANSKGYYVSNDPEEVKRYINSLKQRERAIRDIREKLEADYNLMEH